jgi:FKBP-type peptidyl-prolyl cis-trans isomerase FkpA
MRHERQANVRLMYHPRGFGVPIPDLNRRFALMKTLLAAVMALGMLTTTHLQGATMSEAKTTTTASGLKYEDVKLGTGETATAGKTVSVHYTGWLTDGKKFDSSKDRGQPFEFPLGGRRVIAGWDEGVQGMKVGGVRKLTIPPALGYGARGAGGVIPPEATLVFEVELLGVR